MKKYMFIIAAIFISCLMYAQADSWLWVKHISGLYNSGMAITTDANGNIYVIGEYSGNTIFDNITLNSPSQRIYIAKINSNGNYLWVQQAGASGYGSGYGISADNNGNCYITGAYLGSCTFGDTTLTSSGGNDIFVAKLDTDGNFLWATSAGGSGYDYGFGIDTDNHGNSYITGAFEDTATFGSIAITSLGSTDAFTAKLDTNGSFLWVQQGGGTSEDKSYSIGVDSYGNSYITGFFIDEAVMGNTTLVCDFGEIFIAKIDYDGNFLWAKQVNGNSTDAGHAIATDAIGNSYITGFINGLASFDDIPIYASINAIFVAKLDSDGNFLWANDVDVSYYSLGNSIAIDNSGCLYLSGYFSGQAAFDDIMLGQEYNFAASRIFVAKVDTGGNFLWAKEAGSPTDDAIGYGVATDFAGNCFATGNFKNDGTFGNYTFLAGGYGNTYIAKLSSDGVFVSDELVAPTAYVSHLGNAYPNPFKTGTSGTIKADVPDRETGVFTIYNLRGQVLQCHSLSAGAHEISFSATDIAPGMYFYRLKTPSLCEVKKFVVLK